jgi:hypothetical protein
MKAQMVDQTNRLVPRVPIEKIKTKTNRPEFSNESLSFRLSNPENKVKIK